MMQKARGIAAQVVKAVAKWRDEVSWRTGQGDISRTFLSGQHMLC